MAARARDARLVLRSRSGGVSWVIGGDGPKANGATRSMSDPGGKECDGVVERSSGMERRRWLSPFLTNTPDGDVAEEDEAAPAVAAEGRVMNDGEDRGRAEVDRSILRTKWI